MLKERMEGLHREDVFLSVVIPLFDEEDNIGHLLEQLEDTLQPLDMNYEIILVDDGSSDESWNTISEISKNNHNITGLKLARNFGHQHALLAGLSYAKGQAVISMDADLQHPPSLIPQLLDAHKSGNLVVNTCRKDPEATSFFKRTTSVCFYRIFSFLTDIHMESGSSDFRLLDRAVLNQLLEFKDVDLFLRGAVEWLGYPSTTIPYTAHERFSGISKYSVFTMLKFATGSVVSFSTRPLIVGVWIGIITSTLAFIEIIYILLQVARGNTVQGWASTVGIISFLFGVLFVILGIIGTYLARIHISLQNRPRFIVKEIVNNRGI